jgi:hypothetical protein
VCLFERNSRYGGRVFDYFWKAAPNAEPSGNGAMRFDLQHHVVKSVIDRFNITYREFTKAAIAGPAQSFNSYWEARGLRDLTYVTTTLVVSHDKPFMLYSDDDALRSAFPTLDQSR